MTREEVAALFHRLADLPAAERSAYLATAAISEETRREVSELLSFDSSGTRPLRDAIATSALETTNSTGAASLGRLCGRFRLISLIGRGGMGFVYLAERADGEVVQRAAVKLLQPGLYSSARERFLQERQILASLDHPHIARLLDAGHLEDGQPFLTMEFVEGRPIDQATQGQALDHKLRLFLQVCSAVSYLHRNLVVHRDLKPGNILITSAGDAKLLDFGIAKMLDFATDTTVTSMRMLTPDFASPEQAEGALVTTATDVYSLGAVFYQLLTGHSPHEIEDRSPGGVIAAIVKGQIKRPRIRTPQLPLDLEAIALKTLRKEPSERYASVDQFAGDIEAYLSGSPVQARRGDWSYHARKTFRRHWLPISATLLTVAGLSTGLFVANRQRVLAERRFAEVRQLANRLFDIDAAIKNLPGANPGRQLIVDTSLDYLGRLSKDAGSDPPLQLELARAYLSVALVQGLPASPGLHQMKKAGENLETAGRLIDSALRSQPGNREGFWLAAQIAHDRMSVAESDLQLQSLAFARQCEQRLQQYLALPGPPLSADRASELISLASNVANRYQIEQQLQPAIALTRQMISLASAHGLPPHTGGLPITLARALRRTGDFEGALAAIRVITRRATPPDSNNVNELRRHGLALRTEATILFSPDEVSLGRRAEAAVLSEQALAIAEELARRSPDTTAVRFTAGSANYRVGLDSEPARATAALKQALVHYGAIHNNPRARREELTVAVAAIPLALQMGNRAEADRLLRLGLNRLRELRFYPPLEFFGEKSEAKSLLMSRALYEEQTGNVTAANQTYTELLRALAAAKPSQRVTLDDSLAVSNLLLQAARFFFRTSQSGEALALESRRLAIWRDWDRQLPGNPFIQARLQEPALPTGHPAIAAPIPHAH